MKKLLKLLIIVVTFANFINVNAQFQISPRVGYDMPNFDNNTPYIDYKGGLEAGISFDYYWNWIGVGLDYDYIKNKPESTYPTNFFGTVPADYSLSEAGITRTFLGIGPDVRRISPSGKFTMELNTRIGISNIKGGRTALTFTPGPTLINFHAGYDAKNVLSGKLQARFTYFFNENWGVNAGAYYLRHFGVTELTEGGRSASYFPWTTGTGPQEEVISELTGHEQIRTEPCDCTVSSVGVFAGLTYKLTPKEKVCDVCGDDHMPRCCNTCGCGVTVTARDKFTKEILADTDVVLVNMEGQIVQSGKTNAYGTVVFSDVDPNNYVVKGKLYDVNLDESSIEKSEFKECLKSGKSIQKEIVYSDMNFILKGSAVQCNSTTPLPGVSVVLNNLKEAEQKNTITGNDGEFIFNVKQASSYSIYGKKDSYFSQTETVTTEQYDRSTTLFIKLEICMQKVDCGQAIALQNIHYDLDKYFIREDAKPELNRLVRFMQDNPSISIQVGSHTDSRGSNSYNETLSQNRASAAVDYVVSQGISSSRITGIGFGETVLLNRCADNVTCSKEEHQINRRTEMKVICPE
ncbi:MAG: OmpA family protein [Flavobacteriaceae bacterium]